jgi:hypothetical protein
MANFLSHGLRLARPRDGAAALRGQQRALPGMFEAKLFERRGEGRVRLVGLFQLRLSGIEPGGQAAPLRPFDKSPASRKRDQGGKTNSADQPPLAQQRDHGASSSAAAR